MMGGNRDDAEKRGFEKHEEAQRRAWLRLPPRQQLDWLEGAKRFARRALEAAARRRAGNSVARGGSRR